MTLCSKAEYTEDQRIMTP